MKIIFICGSVEPGKDGVGDYVRCLSGQLSFLGHQISIVSLHDPFVSEVTFENYLASNQTIEILRVPNTLNSKLRVHSVQKWINDIDPEWLSLQYVPYSFNRLGAPVLLAYYLNKITKNAKWHVMVHEPYLGTNASLKKQVIQKAQILSLKLLKWQLKPKIWHTSISHYKKLLETISISTKTLGLFGNIPISENYPDLKNKTEKNIRLIYFGAVPPINQFHVFKNKLLSYIEKYEVAVKITICGRNGADASAFKKELESVSEKVSVDILGEKSPEELSQLFLSADAGISRVSLRLLGKSGSSIAMLEHGLPLWLPLAEEDEIGKYENYRTELHYLELINNLKKLQPEKRITLIADQFIQALVN